MRAGRNFKSRQARGERFSLLAAIIFRLAAIWVRALLKRNQKYPMLLPELEDLQELRVMLAERMEQWAEEFIAQGVAQGE